MTLNRLFIGLVHHFLMAALLALLFFATPSHAQNSASPITGPTSWADYPVKDDEFLRLERLRMSIMTRGEPPLARLERIAHDYAHAESPHGYFDKRLLRRMKADGLTLVESF